MACRLVIATSYTPAALVAAEVKRDEDGYWNHPDFPTGDTEATYCQGESFMHEEFVRDYGMQLEAVMLDDSSTDTVAAWCEYERGDGCPNWAPKPPAGEGWFLLSIYDTEDGPAALFGRARPAINPAAAWPFPSPRKVEEAQVARDFLKQSEG